MSMSKSTKRTTMSAVRGWKTDIQVVRVIFQVIASKSGENQLVANIGLMTYNSQFPWARNSNWSKFYSSAEEIWQYFKDVATKYDLEKYVKFEHKIKLAKWNEERGVWDLTVQAPDGSEFMDYCEILVNGSGVLK